MKKAPKGHGTGPSHRFSSPGVSAPRGVPTVNFGAAGASVKKTGRSEADASRRARLKK